MNTQEKIFDYEELVKLMHQYYQVDPEGCAEMKGKLLQADKDNQRIKELEAMVANLQAQLNQKAG